MNNIESLYHLTEVVETAGTDIAPTYAEYVQLAFAIATDCGEAGREFFHRLCRLSAKYQHEHAERIYSNALIKQHGDIHLGTVFHLSEMAGIEFPKEKLMNNQTSATGTVSSPHQNLTHAHVYNKVDNEKTEDADEPEERLSGSEPHQPLPTFPTADWPQLLMRIISYGTTAAQQDILLLGSLTTLGASIERYVRCPYGGRFQSPCLQTFIVAPSAAGKGTLPFVRMLVEPIHEELRRQSEEELKRYHREKAAYDILGKERAKVEAPQMPLNKMFLIAGNNTGTGILQNIMDADGTGFICEAEADTISSAIGSEYGHWSDTLRKAFDHDRLSYNRRTDREYREVKRSYLSVLLSGTPAQVKSLIPSPENGLFSRQLFYYIYGIRAWVDQFDKDETDKEAFFTAMGLEWEKKLKLLKAHGIHTLRLTDEQKQEFNQHFSNLFDRSNIANGSEMNSSVARLAVNTCRIMAEVATLRTLETPQPYCPQTSNKQTFTPDKDIAIDNIKDNIITRWDITISPEDFKAVLGLVTPLYCHATHILSFLPPTEISHRINADRDAFFDALGNKFTRTQMLEQAEKMEIKANTALTWLKRLVKRRLITSVDGKGSYARVHVCAC
ncbi:Primase C terminal 2 (PriCT-2) [Bacteroides faecichinchillae]|uniref:Primase C terminal 2 (PriCT-2) n=1 Tax=Bacteroides faecichinchillae TaxID=871325 RepID=A0A1M5FH11_9BACE|nr:DUF3987 domain-containing protein [Bacteroides faecichinchillae]THG63603.1 DUF3987 domain-containing protein [Bacteroides faecichinchillae]SHF90793.1 Primase C terminal 2 (PriCT-2) [Bacteroides faecichinchillae]